MLEDDRFLSEIWKPELPSQGRPALPWRSAALERKITAAAISKPRIILSTIETNSDGTSYCHIETRSFELSDRSASALHAVQSRLKAYLVSHRISRLHLRAGASAGQYVGHALNFKIEAALQLLPALELNFVSTQSVSAWVRRERPNMVKPDLQLGARWARLQESALETALFVATNSDRDVHAIAR